MTPSEFLELMTAIKQNRIRHLDLTGKEFTKEQSAELIKTIDENTSIVNAVEFSEEYRAIFQSVVSKNTNNAKRNYLERFRKNKINSQLSNEDVVLKLLDKYFYRLIRIKKYERDIQLGQNDVHTQEDYHNFYWDTCIIKHAIGLIFPQWTLADGSSCQFENVSDAVLKAYLENKMGENGRYYGDELSDDSDNEDEKNYTADQKTERVNTFKKIAKLATDNFWKKTKQTTPTDVGLSKKLFMLVTSIKESRLTSSDTILKKLDEILKDLKGGPNTGPVKGKDRKPIKGLVERARITSTRNEEKALEHLNQIREKKGCLTLEDVEQVKRIYNFTEIFVAQYRGNNYMLDRWNADSRRYHQTMYEVGAPQYSEVILKTLPYCFYTGLDAKNDFLQQSGYKGNLTSIAAILQTFLHCLDFTHPVLDYSDEAKQEAYLFDTIGDRLQHRFSNGIDTHLAQLQTLRVAHPEYWGSYLPSAHNPSVATGNTPYHALKYAYGLKDYYDHPFLPRYHKDGSTEYLHAGKFYASLHPLSALLTQAVKRVSHLDAKGQVVIRQRVAPEKETSFLGFVPADTVFYQFVIKYPSFKDRHGFIHRVKYGFDEVLYNAFAFLIQYSQPLEFSLAGKALREKVLELLREWFCAYHEVLLVEMATDKARASGGFLVYLNQDNSLSFTPDKNLLKRGPANKDSRIAVHAYRELRRYCAEAIRGRQPVSEEFNLSFHGFRLIQSQLVGRLYKDILNTPNFFNGLALRIATRAKQPNDENSLNAYIAPKLRDILNAELAKIAAVVAQPQRELKDEKNQLSYLLNRMRSEVKTDDKQAALKSYLGSGSPLSQSNGNAKDAKSGPSLATAEAVDSKKDNKENSKDKIDLGEWYYEDKINLLLQRCLPATIHQFPQTQLEHKDLLEANLRQAIQKVKTTYRPAIIPIFLHGNHWAGLVIKPKKDGHLQVIYNDPKGYSLKQEASAVEIVKQITAQDQHPEIIDLSVKQQHNDKDCGPFTVDNLVQLATQDTEGKDRQAIAGLLKQPADGSAKIIREQQHALLIKQGDQKQVTEGASVAVATSPMPNPVHMPAASHSGVLPLPYFTFTRSVVSANNSLRPTSTVDAKRMEQQAHNEKAISVPPVSTLPPSTLNK